MATATKKCKACGKEYEYCHTARSVSGIFRWQDVACSPECGSVYLAKIKASRSKCTNENNTAAEFEDLFDCDDDSNEFEKDFDDEDDNDDDDGET